MYLGLEIPAEVREALGAWLWRWMPGTGLEPADPSELRVAMLLLGPDGAGLRAAVERSLAGICSDRIQVGLEGRPTWIVAPGGTIAVLGARCRGGARLRRRLAAGAGFHGAGLPAARFLHPHVLLGSAVSAAGGREAPDSAPGLPDGIRQSFEVVRAYLYLSELEPNGPKHVPLVQFELPRGAAVR